VQTSWLEGKYDYIAVKGPIISCAMGKTVIPPSGYKTSGITTPDGYSSPADGLPARLISAAYRRAIAVSPCCSANASPSLSTSIARAIFPLLRKLPARRNTLA
jgi:hypothetical protein